MIQRKNPENNNSTVIFEEIKSFLYILLLALCIRILVFEPFYIPSGSMRKTTIEGDYLFTSKYSYGYSKHSFIFSPNIFSGRILSSPPERGDIIIFRPPHQMHERFIKRLIGLPGDKVEIINSIVYVNNEPLHREFKVAYEENGISFNEYKEIASNGKFYTIRQINQDNTLEFSKKILYHANNIGPFFVPQDHYFLMGDNRDQSGDSRFELGYVPFENFISKVQFVFFSFGEKLWLDEMRPYDQLIQIFKWVQSFRFDRFFSKIE